MPVGKMVLGLFVLAGSLLAADPAAGTWKLNIDKSKFNPGPPPQTATVTYKETANGIERTGETVSADGKRTSFQYTAQYDGQDYPISGNAAADTIALTRINDRTVEATLKKDGKVVTHARRVISADGKTMTLTIRGRNEPGQDVTNTQVYDKQ